MNPALAEGIHLFNAKRFFEAHEALEAVWLKAQGQEKLFLHGLIQVAAAFHHHARHNAAGFRSLLEKGCKKLEVSGETEQGIDLASLMEQLQPWRELLRAGNPRPSEPLPLPQILLALADDAKGRGK